MTTKPKRERSPGYPGIALDEAIRLAQLLYDHESRNLVPIENAYEHWSFKKGSGSGNIAASALKKFGLIRYEGKGTVRSMRLTDLAMEILLREPGEPEREDAIRRAALLPTIHASLWSLHEVQGLPSDKTLANTLKRDHAFTGSGAADFVSQYRRTLAFAGFTESATIEPDDQVLDGPQMTTTNTPGATSRGFATQQRGESFVIPVSAERRVVIQGPFPLSEDEWNRVTGFLEAARPVLSAQPLPDRQSPIANS